MRYESGVFLCDGALVYIPVGFQPDRVEMFEMTNDALHYIWHRVLEDSSVDAALSSIEGISFDTDGGAAALLANDGGFASYNTGTEAPTINEWTTGRSTAATARTATAPGTFIKPTTSGTDVDGLEADRSAIFECVTAGTGGASEPNWETAIGSNTTDGSTVWQAVNQATYREGYQGFRVAAALMTDSEYHIYDAFMADITRVWGDVDGWVDGIYDEQANAN